MIFIVYDDTIFLPVNNINKVISTGKHLIILSPSSQSPAFLKEKITLHMYAVHWKTESKGCSKL